MNEWLPQLLASGAITATVAIVGWLIATKLNGIDKKLDALTDARVKDREELGVIRARGEEAHRRLDDHMERCHAPRSRRK